MKFREFCNFSVLIFLVVSCIVEFGVNAATTNENSDEKIPEEEKYESDCSSSEVWKSCGTACPTTCDNLNNTDRVCTEQCVSGCFCRDDLVRNNNGYCVESEACHHTCEHANEIWKSCGSACPLTCSNYSNPETVCPAMCVQGCFCAEGLVWNENGDCVISEACALHECSVNEVWRESGPFFQPACSDPHPVNKVYNISGCYCKDGYVRNSDDICVSLQSCQCGTDEEFILNGTGCPNTCKNLNPMNCPGQNTSGCFCKSGLVRDSAGVCIMSEDCEPKCDLNQEYKTGRYCGNTCETRHADCKDSEEVEGCFCVNGTVINEYEVCVPPFLCGEEEIHQFQASQKSHASPKPQSKIARSSK